MASSAIKQHILLETSHFGLQELRFHLRNHNVIEIGSVTLNLHYVKERLDNQSFTIILNDIPVITEIVIKLTDKTIKGVLAPMNRTVLQYQSYEDYYEQ